MTAESLLTAAAVLDQLVAAGAREFFFCPGSRSAPFVYAAAERDGADLRTHVRLDERSAAFHALGAAKVTGGPAVVVTTSGTAVGNLMPAAMEADHAQVPLVLLTADRPPELRGTGANQTTRQPGIFGDHVRDSVDLVVDQGAEAQQITARVQSALEPVLAALHDDDAHVPGPVHVNVALREPLQPALDHVAATHIESPPQRWQPAELKPCSAVSVVPAHLSQALLRREGSEHPPRSTVILAGDGAGDGARLLAESLGLPLLAEPSSNARYGPNAVGPYRLLLDTELGSQIERVLLIGRPTLSRPVGALLARCHVQTAAWQPREVAWYDPGRRRETVLRTLTEVTAFVGRPPQGWLGAWQRLGAAAQRAVNHELALPEQPQPQAMPDGVVSATTGVLPGPVVAREVWAACLRDGAPLVAGSSNPIRDLDLCADPWAAVGEAAQNSAGQTGPSYLGQTGQSFMEAADQTPAGGTEPNRGVTVMANRGLAGIDGTVATAAGAALATGRRVRALMGDVTFLHDAGSLIRLVHETQPDLQIVVLDDRGGGIFNTLEHGALGEQPQWAETVERFFGTEPAVDIPALCAGYGVAVETVTTVQDLHRALAQPRAGVSVVVVPASREGLRSMSARIKAAVAAAAAELPLSG
ncbi:2-succinyl-5-enolpyruvyl-6-hydroxy-3-cyclohexene-1-carboxylic-acid synthase [Kocuria sp.]|uniref:2-succinyl-5-enolpyruvyl-6-hydroxy-3- cyclohexene-1-carboxylic-acid synthase n=1 Tax=Kocuria sp. TaxID=1871328 RepID=UPI0026E00DF2|nr:2-succinyl-5-enolpyruvyl-6-hydroxy-3-cyclohexene-1-carboxylic-acid synthase [Kocuria sp.]MDO5617472.1 2-succinyl-5-enolpyruvyl-6-hydroxy-3-cyclohexene-1-carboxylic-acid synthase [Kocuria sp.]